MPKTEKQRRMACAKASGADVMPGMSKAKAKEWCHSKPHGDGRERMTRRKK